LPVSIEELESVEREASTLGPDALARFLYDHLGPRITAYLSGVADPRVVRRWLDASVEPEQKSRIRLQYAYQAARMLIAAYDDRTAQNWFFGTNRRLDDEAPAFILRHGETPDDLRLVVPAARAFAGAAD
jgi:hypothetical protein